MNFSFEIRGERAVAARFETFPRQARDRLAAVMVEITAQLAAAVRGATPSRTGRLRAQVASEVQQREDRVRGRVFTRGDHAKVAALEYGAHHAGPVAAHAMRLDHVFAHHLAAPIVVMVSAHTRTPNIAEHRMFRDSLAAARSGIIAALRRALDEAAR